MSGLELGGPAPDFTLRDQFGQDVTLSSYRGQKAVRAGLLPVRVLRGLHRRDGRDPDRLAEFLTFDSEVLAISCDPIYALRAFADADGLNFPLLSDFWPHGEVTRAYDVFDEGHGRRRAGRRTSWTRRACSAGRSTTPAPRAATSTSTCASCARRLTPEPGRAVPANGLDQLRNNPSGGL